MIYKKAPAGFEKLSGRVIITAGTVRAGEQFCYDGGFHPRDPLVMIVTPDSCSKLRGLYLTAADKVLHSPTMHLYVGDHLKVIQLDEQIKMLLSHARRR